MPKYTHTERDKAIRIIVEMTMRNKHSSEMKRALRASGFEFSIPTYNAWRREAQAQIRERTGEDPRDLAAVQVAILERSQAQALEDRDAAGVAGTNKRIAAMCGIDAPAMLNVTVEVNVRVAIHAALTTMAKEIIQRLDQENQAKVLPLIDQLYQTTEALLLEGDK